MATDEGYEVAGSDGVLIIVEDFRPSAKAIVSTIPADKRASEHGHLSKGPRS